MNPISANANITKKDDLIRLCVEITGNRKQYTPENYNKYVYCLNQIVFIWYISHGCSSMVLQQ